MRPRIVSTIGAVLIIWTASCASAREGATAPESVLQFFPGDTYGMLFVDVAGLRGNALVDEWAREQSGSRIPESLDGFSERTGLNFRTDVEEIAFGASGSAGLLAVVRADYDPERAAAYFDASGFPTETHANRRIYQPDSARDWKVSFIEDYVLMGPDGAIRGAIDRIEDPSSTAADNLDLVERLRSLRDGSHVWATGRPDLALLPGGEEAPQMAADVLSSVQRGTYQMRLGDTVTGQAVGEFADPEAALRTANLFQGLVTLGRIQAARFPGLGEFLDGLEIEAIESAVHLNFEVDPETLRRLRGSAAGLGN